MTQDVGAWKVEETISPLTNAKTFSASIKSAAPVLNMLDRPEPAELVLRCQEGVRAAYISWPQVLSAPYKSILLDLPETLVLTKIDDGAIVADTWVVSNDGIAAGSFDNAGAPKIMAHWRGAKRLVVRMRSKIQQDAVFDLTGINDVIDRVEATCGGGHVAALLPAVSESPSVSMPAQGRPQEVLAAAAADLTALGFTGVTVGSATVAAPLQPFKLTARQADCGKVFGLPYLADGRSRTQVAVTVALGEGRATVKLSIAGLMKTGVGAPDKPLRCKSTGALERDVLERAVGAPLKG